MELEKGTQIPGDRSGNSGHGKRGGEADRERRGFLKGAGLPAVGAAVGATVPERGVLPSGSVGEAFADTMAVAGEDGLIVLNDGPVNAEPPRASAG